MSSETTAVAVQYRLQEWAAQIRDCQSRLAGMTVKLDTTSAVRAIEIDHDHEAAYYTIQGRRVSASTLQPGLYIRVRGNKADKIVVR